MTLIAIVCLVVLRLYFFPTYATSWDAGQYSENLLHLRLAHGPYIYHHLLGLLLSFLWREDTALAVLGALSFALASLSLIRLASRHCGSELAGGLAFAVFAFLPVVIQYSCDQEVYSMQSALVVTSLLFATDQESKAANLLAGVFWGLAMGTHNGTILLTPSLLLPFLPGVLGSLRRRQAPARLLRWACGASLAYAPALVAIVASFLYNGTRVVHGEAFESVLSAAWAYALPGNSPLMPAPIEGSLWMRTVAICTAARHSIGTWMLTLYLGTCCAMMVHAGRAVLRYWRQSRSAPSAAVGPVSWVKAATTAAILTLPLPYWALTELAYGRPADLGLHVVFVAPSAALALPLAVSLGTSIGVTPLQAAWKRLERWAPAVTAVAFIVGLAISHQRIGAIQAQQESFGKVFEDLRRAAAHLPRDAYLITVRDPHRIPYYASMRSLFVRPDPDDTSRTIYNAYTTPWNRFAMHSVEVLDRQGFKDLVDSRDVYVSNLTGINPWCEMLRVAQSGGVKIFRLHHCR